MHRDAPGRPQWWRGDCRGRAAPETPGRMPRAHPCPLDMRSGSNALPTLRHDPFDRLLLAQALVERCRFLTADRRLLGLGRDWILPAVN